MLTGAVSPSETNQYHPVYLTNLIWLPSPQPSHLWLKFMLLSVRVRAKAGGTPPSEAWDCAWAWGECCGKPWACGWRAEQELLLRSAVSVLWSCLAVCTHLAAESRRARVNGGLRRGAGWERLQAGSRFVLQPDTIAAVGTLKLEEQVITCSSEPPEAKCSPVLEKATLVTGPWSEGNDTEHAREDGGEDRQKKGNKTDREAAGKKIGAACPAAGTQTGCFGGHQVARRRELNREDSLFVAIKTIRSHLRLHVPDHHTGVHRACGWERGEHRV
ncbi:hypothetical protein EYF80_007540 [Liparis tanakae]|uniref:Uncharacterized protein n=1 Tax=Liparis tanakae TaxID=230148 RepID=A0A4Z2IXZ4_9TELE|nr:hypothetical protein EYF80_007540 [Liparis tanakae]